MTHLHISRGGCRLFTSNAEFRRWNDMPYGMWRTSDGREVLFNRFYEPIYQRKDGVVCVADPKEWVKQISDEHWFYNDSFSEYRKRKAAQEALNQWLPDGPV